MTKRLKIGDGDVDHLGADVLVSILLHKDAGVISTLDLWRLLTLSKSVHSHLVNSTDYWRKVYHSVQRGDPFSTGNDGMHFGDELSFELVEGHIYKSGERAQHEENTVSQWRNLIRAARVARQMDSLFCRGLTDDDTLFWRALGYVSTDSAAFFSAGEYMGLAGAFQDDIWEDYCPFSRLTRKLVGDKDDDDDDKYDARKAAAAEMTAAFKKRFPEESQVSFSIGTGSDNCDAEVDALMVEVGECIAAVFIYKSW